MVSPDRLRPFTDKMKQAHLPRAAIDSFRYHLDQLLSGTTGTLCEDRIRPVESLPDGDRLEQYRTVGEELLTKVVVIKLNGGLGTGMGLKHAKSLIEVRDGMTFLDLIARQMLHLRDQLQKPVPLLLMNSYRTDQDSTSVLADYPELCTNGVPLSFVQNRVPKVHREKLVPVENPDDPSLEWCPPGHGDIYTALGTSGALMKLLGSGIEYAFVSNADNLGAVLDPRLLGYMAEQSIDFLMEAADRTESDRKGGHLCLIKGAGLALRESAQCPCEERDAFQNISRYRYFNTNNLWIHLPSLAALIDHHGGVLPLHTILNRKTVDPTDPTSEPVYHLETAMGSAISLFPNAAAVRVPRSRFSPVKTTSDLLGVRSDAFVLTADRRVILNPQRTEPPAISLDHRYYSMLSSFEERFPSGPPSLKSCDSLTVIGDIVFGHDVRIEGSAKLSSAHDGAKVSPGSVLSGNVVVAQ